MTMVFFFLFMITMWFKFSKNFCYECLQQILEKNEAADLELNAEIQQIKKDPEKLYDEINSIANDNASEDLEKIIEEEETMQNQLSDSKLELKQNMETLDIILSEFSDK